MTGIGRGLLKPWGEACAKTGWQVHAYCLLPNHFHLVVETPQGNLVAGVKWLLGTYTGRFNRRHKFTVVRRGWCLGDKAFRKELLEQMGERREANHYGEEVRESAEGRAEGMVEEELRRRGWSEAEFRERAKGDKGKVAMAVRLRRETTLTLKWVAERLAMGSWRHVSNLLAAVREKAR